MARTARHGSIAPSRPAVRDLRRSLRVGLQPNPIIHCVAETLFAALGPLRRLHRDMPQKELNLLHLPAGLMTKTGTSPMKVVWCERLNITSLRFLLHDTQMTLGLNPLPQIRPALLIERRSVPVLIRAAVIQTSIPAFTQSGIGMVRMWPHLPTRSAMTQCSALCCTS